MNDTMTDTLDDDLRVTDPGLGSTEPRGPHLPDALAGVPFGAWAFGLLALARLIWFVRETELGPSPGPDVLLAYVSGFVPAVVAVLLPAVLLLRHPDAWTRARTLLLGTVLLAVVEGMRVLSPALQPVFEQVTPGSDETPYLVPLSLFYSFVQGLLATFAVANIGLGLAQSRRYLDRSGTIVILFIGGAVALVAAAARVITISRLPFDEIPMTPTVAVYLASAIVIGVLSIAAWGYLAASSARGVRAGEDPGAGWIFAAFGAWSIMAAFVVGAVANLAEPTPATQGLFTTLGQGISVAHTLGYVGLLVALLLGMPSLEPLEVDPDDGDPGDADGLDALETAEPDSADGQGAGAPDPFV